MISNGIERIIPKFEINQVDIVRSESIEEYKLVFAENNFINKILDF